MDMVELLSKFADPQVIKTLPFAEKITAGLVTTLLGMGITFLSLIILQFVIGLLAKLTAEKTGEQKEVQRAGAGRSSAAVSSPQLNDEEVIAAITTALALHLKTSVSNIVVRNIERVDGTSPAWHRAGIAEHMNNSL